MREQTTEKRSLRLEAARCQFQSWRRSRPKHGRVPTELWALAVDLVGEHGLPAVSRALGVDVLQLEKQVASRGAALASPRACPGPGFVELAGAQVFGAVPPPEVVVEVAHPAGPRLTLRLPMQGLDVPSLVQAFCGHGGGRA